MGSAIIGAIDKLLRSGERTIGSQTGEMRRYLENRDGLIYTLDDPFVIKIMKIGPEGSLRFFLDDRNIDYSEGDRHPHENLFFALDQFLRGNLAGVNLSLLEKRFGYGRNFYNRVIRENRGMTLTGYLQKLRLEESERLLLNTDLSVSRIIEKVGYANRQHFYEIFKEQFRHTPREYRLLNKL